MRSAVLAAPARPALRHGRRPGREAAIDAGPGRPSRRTVRLRSSRNCSRRATPPWSCSRTCTGPTRPHSTWSSSSPAASSACARLLVLSYRDDELGDRPPAATGAGRPARRCRRARASAAVVRGRRRRTGAAIEPFRRRHLRRHRRQSVLRHRSAARRRPAGDGARCGACTCGAAAADRARAARPRGDRARRASRSTSSTRCWRRRRRTSSAALASGLLIADGHSYAFRHELARIAIEQALPRADGRRAACAGCWPAWEQRGEHAVAMSRLVHHASGAGDSGGGAEVRAAGWRRGRLARRASRSRLALRHRAGPRRRAGPGRARASLLERHVLPVLRHRPERRADRSATRGAGDLARARRRAPGRADAALVVAPELVSADAGARPRTTPTRPCNCCRTSPRTRPTPGR